MGSHYVWLIMVVELKAISILDKAEKSSEDSKCTAGPSGCVENVISLHSRLLMSIV